MNKKSNTATSYVNQLYELLLSTTVTDITGSEMALDEGADRAVDLILDAHITGNKAMVIGNGGSAAIASHLHNDLCKAVGVKSLVFHEQPLLTALANDHGYSCVFERPINMWAEENDLLVAISSSGGSENILCGTKAAIEKGCQIITLSGFKPDNPLRTSGSLNFYVASQSYGFVEVAHSALAHLFTDLAINKNTE
ncbi:SIS domain-containing protein [Thermodesulfobacteriota bacterium]